MNDAGDRRTGSHAITVDNLGIATAGVQVDGHLTVNHNTDPKLLQPVEGTVAKRSGLRETKDNQIRLRNPQTAQLSAAVAALARREKRPGAAPGVERALAGLAKRDTSAATANFRDILQSKSAAARAASHAAASAAQHLGALAAVAIPSRPVSRSIRPSRSSFELKPGQLTDQLPTLSAVPQ